MAKSESKNTAPRPHIGIFGGTFNPIHLGHVRSAEEIRQTCALDHIYFVPSARPPHKDNRELVSGQHRLRMVELAVADEPAFSASGVELERPGPSYSVDTLRHFWAALPSASLSFILGLDAFLEMQTWKDYRTIPHLCNLIVTSRPGTPRPSCPLPVEFQSVFCYDPLSRMYTHPSHSTLVICEISGLDISASTIRRNIRSGTSVRSLVHPAVAAYIADHDLYQR